MYRWQVGILVSLLLSLSSAVSFAVIVPYNDPTLPPSADGFNITWDTSTGREWLDVDVTAGRTFDDLTGVDGTNEFLPGSDFPGFRYAIKEELNGAQNGPQLPSLFLSLGISPFEFSSIGGYPVVRTLLEINGCFGACAVGVYPPIPDPAAYGYVWGIILDNDGVTVSQSSLETFWNGGNNFGRHEPNFHPVFLGLNPPNPVPPPPASPFGFQGSWIVRVVPIPAPFVLLLSALAILSVRARKLV